MQVGLPGPEHCLDESLVAEGIESKVNIEALFNAVHRNKALIKAMFQAR